MFKKIALFVSIITLLSFTIINNFRELVIQKLEVYTNDYPEKIYVKTDKPYYVIGDDIWYAAYLVNGITHKKSSKSNVIYVELINDKDSIVSQKKLYTNDISASGDIEIKKEWRSGTYLLRAYTNHMRNSNSDYFFQKEIPVWDLKENDVLKHVNIELDNNDKISVKEAPILERPELNFYPEGGYLINGIQSKIGIKVKDKKNRNINIEGIIKDSENNTISTFKTFQFGLSLLTLKPESGKTYQASIIINGKEETYNLPKPLPQGFNLNLINNGNEIILKTTSNSSIGLKNSLLVGHQRGKVVFEKFIETSSNTYTLKLNTSELNSGVTHFTLFDNNGKPVCERLVFIDNPSNNINIGINKDVNIPKIREEVTLQLDLKDKKGNPVSGNLSLTINDLDAIEKNSNYENIKTYLLLNSDLRGHVKNPGYFFEKENDAKRRFLLDLVMMTHGWSRFTWNDILYKAKNKNQYQIEKGIFISGQTRALKEKGKRISSATRLTFMGPIPQQELKQSDTKGQFNFGPYVFYDSIPTIIEARVKQFKSDFEKNRDVDIFLRNNTYRSPEVSLNNTLKQNNINQTVITNFFKQSQNISEIDNKYSKGIERLEEIIITAKKETEEEKREEELNDRSGNSFPTHRLDMNDILNPEAFSVFSLLSQLPGVSVFNDSISIRNGGTPIILLDGFQVEVDDISFLTGFDIEFIDVLTGASASIIANSGNGVIAIYTKLGNGSLLNVKRKPGIIDFYYPGFYAAREFYSPDYADSFYDYSKQDIRTTLHWEPKIVITKDAKAEVTFFTSDTRSKYAIEIEGITNEGLPVYSLSTFEVD